LQKIDCKIACKVKGTNNNPTRDGTLFAELRSEATQEEIMMNEIEGLSGTRRDALRVMAAGGAAAALVLPRIAATATLAQIRERGSMTVATEDNFQPFEFFRDGKATGYDVELLELMKKKVAFAIKEEFIPWTGILPGVSTGKYDAAVTAVLVTKERLEALEMTSPIAENVNYYLKRKNDARIKGVKDLSGMTLGVEAGSAMLKLLPQLDEVLKPTGGKLGKIVEYQGYPEAYQDLANSRLDIVVNTYLSVRSVADARPNVFEVGQAVSKPTFIAWALQKGNSDLLKTFNDFLLGARQDGSMYALQEKWFGTTFKDMPEAPAAEV
jgi:polar amino acid transport system substrate-binding protein